MPENSANRYVVPVEYDTSGSVAAVQEMINSLQGANRAASDAGNTARRAMTDTATASRNAANAVEDVAENMGDAAAAANELRNNAQAAGTATRSSMDTRPIRENASWWQRLVGVVRSFAQGVREGYQEAVDGARRARDEQGRFVAQSQSGFGSLNGLLQKGAGLIAGYFGVQAIINFGKQIIETTALFEKMQATLTVALGSGSAAAAAMERIQELAKTTPFGVEELTASFVKLVNRGFIPTNAELVKLGDLAASQGKSIDQLIEAVLDAQTGEFERLKEFGIRASQSNGQVTLSFRGVTETVKLTDEAVRNALLSFGEMDGVLGAMAGQAATTGGQISNLQDQWQLFAKNMGQVFGPAIAGVLDLLNGVVGALQDTAEWLQRIQPGYDAAREGAEAYRLTTERLTAATSKGAQTVRGEVMLMFQDLEANAQRITETEQKLAALPDSFWNRSERAGLEETLKNLKAIDAQTRQAYADFYITQKKMDDQRKQSSIPTAAELQKAEQERLKAQREANEQTKQRIALEKQLRDLEAKGNTDTYARQQDQLAATLESAQAELDNQARIIQQSKKLSNDQIASLELINKIKIQLQENYYQDSIKLAEQYSAQQLKREFDYQEQVISLQKDSRQKALDEVDLWEKQQMEQARAQYADDIKRRTDLQFEIAQAAERRRKEVNTGYDLQDIQREEELNVALEEIAVKYADRSLKSERAKQEAILKIKIEAANKSIALLEANGDIESRTQAAQMRKVVQDMQKELGDLQTGSGDHKVSLLEYLGMGEDDIEKMNDYIDKVEAVAGVISNVTKAIIASTQRQIEAKDEIIEKYNEEIDELERNVDEQRELAEQGKANDLEAAEDELAQKQKLRDAEIKQREELLKKQEKLQQAQLVLDTISQVSNLVTAASKIFSAYASIPFVGVALAAAAVIAMYAAFASAKSTASSATASYGGGGEIDGASHATGGVKYRSIGRGANRTIELEGGEYVIKRKSTSKHKRMIEALNADNFSNLPVLDASFRQMLAEMGIAMPDQDGKPAALNQYQQLQSAPVVVINAGNGKVEALLKQINGNVGYIADEKRNEEKVEYEDTKIKRVKIGNRKRTIHKKNG